jgi:hypothetical protein
MWHGTLREHYLVLFTAAGLIALVAGFVAAWIGAQFGARRAARDAAAEAVRQLGMLTERRLELLQQSIESVAVEVERIAEAQRFSAAILADRGSARTELPVRSVPRSEARIPTPH